MPDDQINPRNGLIGSAPVRAENVVNKTLADPHISPAIYDLSAVNETDLNVRIEQAAFLGFNSFLLAEPFNDAIHAGRRAGLRALLAIDISTANDESFVAGHPDWFVHSSTGTKFLYLSEVDAAVSWWDAKVAAWVRQGIVGFICQNATEVPASVWRHIISKTHDFDANIEFYASTFGATPAQIESLHDCGFSYCMSSSCWWDFSAGWLNDETDQLKQLAPPIALASPPITPFLDREDLRCRALVLASMFGAGWLMPSGFEVGKGYDLCNYITELNRLRQVIKPLHLSDPAKVTSSPGSKIALLERGQAFLMAINPSIAADVDIDLTGHAAYVSDTGVSWTVIDATLAIDRTQTMTLPPAGVRFFEVAKEEPITTTKRLTPDCDAPRIAIEAITPKVDEGQFPVRRVVGETLIVEADLISDGHDKLAAELIYRPVDKTQWQCQPMHILDNDRWRGACTLPRLGRYIYAVRAWKDVFATLADEITKKHNSDVNTHLEIIEAIALVKDAAATNDREIGGWLHIMLSDLSTLSDDEKRVKLLDIDTIKYMRAADVKKFSVQSDEIIVDAERLDARFASWYEIFPRSQSGDSARHGTFQDVIAQLPRIAEMGFNVLYFPPIHPIGHKNRKGPNNTLTPGKKDPGSPYAIGNEHGGHDAIHPELGTVDDFHKLRLAAARFDIELALDFAIQCAPDHPWLHQHKDWFDWRPDGSVRFAENPPKKYEDIVNVDFYAPGARPSLWIALRDVVQFWVDQGIKLFRVDNPHTKPIPFWEWLINDIRGRHPEVVFLAEAFTRPKMMYRLSKIGFSQSYTYFTWRNTKAELQEYLTELNTAAAKDFFRPHFFVNTPDINPVFLQNSGRSGFLIRAALAATLSGLWGVYNGFELCEAKAVPGKEEYLDSEKYQIRVWDHNTTDNIIEEITRLNKIRRRNKALHSHLGLKFHNVYDDQVIFFSKIANDGNAILVAVSLDPFNTRETTIELPLWMFDQPDDGALLAEDLMRDHQFTWYGKYQPVMLYPQQPFCIWRVQRPSV